MFRLMMEDFTAEGGRGEENHLELTDPFCYDDGDIEI